MTLAGWPISLLNPKDKKMNKTIKNDPAIRITHTKQLVEFLPRQKVIK